MTKNYIDFIPVRGRDILYEISDNKLVTLKIQNKGILKKRKISYIHLDEIGSFVWFNMNGENSIYDISLLIKERFGDKAEPLFNRLVVYIKEMEEYGFICIDKR